MEGEHTIYLSSSGNKDIFPDNIPSRFTNRLSSPILLDSNINYEIGLVSILYPDQYYGVVANNPAYDINVYTSQKRKSDGKEFIKHHIVKVNKNIVAGNIQKLIQLINSNLIKSLKIHYYDLYQFLFSDQKIISWNEEEDKAEIHFNKVSDEHIDHIGDIQRISLRVNYGLASILGFRSDTEYVILDKYETIGNKLLSYHPPSPKCGVDYIYLYTDIIHPTNFAGQLINILDCFTLNNGGNKGIHNTVYKPLNVHVLDQISIIITDQQGRHIQFTEDSTVTLLLHIRPR